MEKQELYEYQYTTPNKKVVKELLPAVRKPVGKSKQKKKIFLGRVFEVIGVLGLLGIPGMLGEASLVFIIIKLLIFGGALGIGISQIKDGKNYLYRCDRYLKYMKVLEDKKYASIEDLASKVAKNVKTVVSDIEFMIQQNWFLEGHLDHNKSQFMLTDQVYEQYKLLEQGRAIREQEEKEKQEKENDPKARELAKLLEEGDAYVKQIHSLNDAILGAEISDQLYKIEDVVASIFELVKRKPEKMQELRKLMQYYLPMTIKVVTSYRDFENERIPSQQLDDSKQEIEQTLDKVYIAFVKLREKLFREDVLDVSTDLDVLEAMMSQEGLIPDDFNTSKGE